MYVSIVSAAFAQVIGLALIIKSIVPNLKIFKETIGIGRALLCLSAVALSAKLLLQLASTIPSLSKLAFGFRPIVIGYLHLVLLGVITLFIIGFMFINRFINLNKLCRYGAAMFVSGIMINELLLMMQGIMGMSYESIPYISDMLLGAAVIMFSGLLVLVWSQRSTQFLHKHYTFEAGNVT